jgi:hypothetical protein
MAKSKEKKVVQYAVTPHTSIQVGMGALVSPVDHPDTENVTNGLHAFTSEVLSYDTETGEFETLNTKYVPQKSVTTAEESVVQ